MFGLKSGGPKFLFEPSNEIEQSAADIWEEYKPEFYTSETFEEYESEDYKEPPLLCGNLKAKTKNSDYSYELPSYFGNSSNQTAMELIVTGDYGPNATMAAVQLLQHPSGPGPIDSQTQLNDTYIETSPETNPAGGNNILSVAGEIQYIGPASQ